MIKSKHIVIMLLSIALSCRDPYEPKILSSPNAYLVVEGILNVNGPTSISLSRTSSLDSSGFTKETSAQVLVEGKDNIIRSLSSNGAGNYSSPDLSLVVNGEYRLRIQTADGKEYLSEYVKARQTPAIDSIIWKQDDEGVKIFVSTHDPSGNTRYYRWDFDETWEIWSYFTAGWVYIKDSNIVRPKLPHEDASVGWKYAFSTDILLGSSASLTDDVIPRAPIHFINDDDEKISRRYSILVRQYAMDKTGYAFYELMKKNTESLGTIFDAQPSELKSNILCVSDPEETVVGYVSAATTAEKRIFISNHELASWNYQQNCVIWKVPNNPDSTRVYFGQGGLLPWDVEYATGTPGLVAVYVSSFGKCVDVTRRGASLVKPSYW